MSEYDEWDDDDAATDDGQGSKAIKEARASAKANAKRVKELEELLNSTKAALRERSVKDVLTAKGVKTSIAKYIPAELSSEEDIEKWVTDNAEDFGITVTDGSEGGQQPASDPNTASLTNIGNVQATGQAFTGDVDQIRSLIESANTPAELDALMAQYRTQ